MLKRIKELRKRYSKHILSVMILSITLQTGVIIFLLSANQVVQDDAEIKYVYVDNKLPTSICIFETRSDDVEVKPEKRTIIKPCCTKSTFKSYMDFKKITNKSSRQYRLQKDAYTEDGFRKVDGRVMVAMANFKVGDLLDLTFEDGSILEVIIGDIKANTKCTHPDGSMLEFIVDTKTMNPRARKLGSFHEIFPGSIVSIELMNNTK